MTTWQPGQPVPPGYCVEILEDGTERLVESWPDSPGSEPVEEDDDGFKEIAILCEPCYQNGCWDSMWPGGNHDNEHVWGVAEMDTEEGGDWIVTWLETRLTVAEAEEHLAQMDFHGGYHLMS